MKPMTATLQHRLLSLKTRLDALCEASDDYSSIDFDEEAKSIFDRYEKIRTELIALDTNIFGELVVRRPTMGTRDDTFERKSLTRIRADLVEIDRGLTLIEQENSDIDYRSEKMFWSRRTNPASALEWFKATGPAIVARIDRLGKEGYFVQDFSDNNCSYCEAPFGFSVDKVNSALKEHIPDLLYRLGGRFKETDIYDLVEFFYEHAVSPTDWQHCGDDKCPSKYSRQDGRKYYTTEINKIFGRFGAPYRLVLGQVTRVTSPIVEKILDEPIVTEDIELNKQLTRAVAAFRDRTDKRIEAAEICCKAFEHFKCRYGANAKSSTQAIIAELVSSEDQAEKLNVYWKALTDLGHAANRHSKPTSPSTSDSEFAEYLFLQYYTAIYFGCRKFERKKEGLDNALRDELSVFTLSDEIPF